MKRLLLVLAVLLFLVVPVHASKITRLSADGLVVTGAGYLHALVIITDGTNTCDVLLYDNTAASGTVHLGKTWTVVGGDYQGGLVGVSLRFTTGLYADLTTSGTCAVTVQWDRTPAP